MNKRIACPTPGAFLSSLWHSFGCCFPKKTTILTVPESPMFSAPEAEIVTAPRLGRVREAGRQYAENGEVGAALLSEIGSPMIPEETCARIVNAASSGEA